MYNEHFGFATSPFENNLDQRFLYLSRDHKEVLAALQYFVRENKAFAIVCGDVGTGKTMLLNCFLNNLPPMYHPIVITNPTVAFREILLYVAQVLGIENTERTTLDLIDEVRLALLEAQKHNESYFLIIDEAHLLDNKSLDDIRLVSNIETSDRKLLPILLVGQYELSYKLRSPKMRQLRQRLNINRFLSSLDYEETKNYINHRLQVVGSSLEECFQPKCLAFIYRLTNGVPREINRLCDSALLVSKGAGLRKVDKATLKKASRALRSDLIFTPSTPKRGFQKLIDYLPKTGPAFAVVAGIATLFLAGIFFLNVGNNPTPAFLTPDPNPSGPVTPEVTAQSLENSATTEVVPQISTTASDIPSAQEAALSPGAIATQISPEPPINSTNGSPKASMPSSMSEKSSTPTPEATPPSSPPLRNAAGRVDSQEATETRPSPTGKMASMSEATPELRTTPLSAPPPEDREIAPHEVPVFQGRDDSTQPSPEISLSSPRETLSPTKPSKKPSSAPVETLEKVTVQKGDTLTTIISRRSPEHVTATLDALLNVNPFIKNPDLIFPGQVLLLPRQTGASSPPERPSTPQVSVFTIQVCTLSRSSRTVAEDYASYLQGKGYPTHVEEMRARDGNTMFKICIGRYQTEAEAIEAALHFQEKEGKPFIIMRSEPEKTASGTESP